MPPVPTTDTNIRHRLGYACVRARARSMMVSRFLAEVRA